MAQAIITKFCGPTNTKGSRIQVKGWLKTVYVSWDHALNSEENHAIAVAKYVFDLNKQRVDGGLKWDIIGGGMMPDESGYAFIIGL